MKYEFKRRRAIKCEFVEKSKTSPGYLKYEDDKLLDKLEIRYNLMKKIITK